MTDERLHRLVWWCLLAAIVATILFASRPAAAVEEWRTDECRYGGLVSGSWTQHEVALTIACAAHRWPVPGGVGEALSVARCESGLRATASNGGRYLGVFQHAASAWSSRVRSLDPPTWAKPLAPSAFNARSNVVVAIRMAHQSGWSRDWPGCA